MCHTAIAVLPWRECTFYHRCDFYLALCLALYLVFYLALYLVLYLAL
jgi:hypothetical protein